MRDTCAVFITCLWRDDCVANESQIFACVAAALSWFSLFWKIFRFPVHTGWLYRFTLHTLCLVLKIIIVWFSPSDLIKSHKQTAPQGSGTGSHVSSVNNNVNNNGRSFSWQRSKQLEKEKKQPVSGPPHNQVEGQPAVVKSSYSLDRRKISGNSSGTRHCTYKLSWLIDTCTCISNAK